MELDHVVHYVEDLDKARNQYQELGFVTQEGGKHSYGTQNIVTRVHRGYIEPITIVDWDLLRERRPMSMFNLLHEVITGGGGAISFGLSVSNIEQVAERLQNEGMKFTLRESSIQSHDGTKKSWTYILLNEGPSSGIRSSLIMAYLGKNVLCVMERRIIGRLAVLSLKHRSQKNTGIGSPGLWGHLLLQSREACVLIKNGDVDVVKGSAERITCVLFKEFDAPVGYIQGLKYGVDS